MSRSAISAASGKCPGKPVSSAMKASTSPRASAMRCRSSIRRRARARLLQSRGFSSSGPRARTASARRASRASTTAGGDAARIFANRRQDHAIAAVGRQRVKVVRERRPLLSGSPADERRERLGGGAIDLRRPAFPVYGAVGGRQKPHQIGGGRVGVDAREIAGDDLQGRPQLFGEAFRAAPADGRARLLEAGEALVDDRGDRAGPPRRRERGKDELLERDVARGLVERELRETLGAQLNERFLGQPRRWRHGQPFRSRRLAEQPTRSTPRLSRASAADANRPRHCPTLSSA